MWDDLWFLTHYSWKILWFLVFLLILSLIKHILIVSYFIIFTLIFLINIDKNWFCWILNRYLFKYRVCLNWYFSLLPWHTDWMVQDIRTILNWNLQLLIIYLHWNLVLRNILHLHRNLMILNLHHTHTLIVNLILKFHHTDTLILNLKGRLIKLDTHLLPFKEIQIAHAIIV